MKFDELVAKRSAFGRDKYRVLNPEVDGGETMELFWFRDLLTDMVEELADAAVYRQRLQERLNATQLAEGVRLRIDALLLAYDAGVAGAYEFSQRVRRLLVDHAPALTEDQVEYWGPFKRRMTLAE